MNLQPINPPAPAFSFTCTRCAITGPAFPGGYADLDDEPGTFYCNSCGMDLIAKLVVQETKKGEEDE